MTACTPGHHAARFVAALLLAAGNVTVAPAAAADPASPAATATAPGQAEALAAYEDGKRAYDAGDYEAALRAFSRAARFDPLSARWQYNLGLTLRQLGHYQAAREAFLAAGRLDPDYKRVEIAQKLRSMGLDGNGQGRPPTARAESPAGGMLPWLLLGSAALAGGAGIVLWRRRRRRSAATADSGLTGLPDRIDPAAIETQYQRLIRLGTRLVRAEYALVAGEDPEIRSRLDRATAAEQEARRQLAAAGAGRGVALAAATRAIDDAESLAFELDSLLGKTAGPAPAAAPRCGCWFCARPLANVGYQRRVPLLTGGDRVEVLACPDCAERVRRGESPEVLIVGDGGRPQHWSEAAGYDPWLHRHAPPPQASLQPVWKLQPRRPLAELAKLAAGGAAVAGLFFAGRALADDEAPIHGLDLDAARETGLAAEAARVAAQRAGREGRDGPLHDHS